jgi:hypothetical protein
MTDTNTKAFGYIRKSTNEASRQVASLQAQRDEIQHYAHKYGLDLLDVFEDSISGDAERREGFEEMMHRAVHGREVQHICVWKFNRFSREEPLDCMGHYKSLFGTGVSVHSTSEGRIYKNARDIPTLVMLLLDSAQSHEFLRNLSADVSRGFVSKMEAAKRHLESNGHRNGSHPPVGWPIGRIPPYGYDALYFDAAMKPYQVIRYHAGGLREIFDLEGKRGRVLPKGVQVPRSQGDAVALVPSTPERVDLVREIFAMYGRRGLGPKQIAKELNDRESNAPRGGDWSMGTIRVMTRCPAYTGITAFNRKSRGKYSRIVNGHGRPHEREINPDTGRPYTQVHNPKEDWFLVEGTHEPLVDRETWDLAQKVGEARTLEHKSRRPKNGRYLLSGLIRCTIPGCGHNFIGHVYGERIYYRCGGYQYGSGCRKSQQFPERLLTEPIRNLVISRVEQVIKAGGDEILVPFLERELQGAGRGRGAGRRGALEKKIEEIGKQVDTLVRGIDPDLMDMVNNQLRGLKAERTRLKNELASLPLEPVAGLRQEDSRKALQAMKRYIGNLRQVFDRGEVQEMKQMFRAFVHRIWIHSERQFAKIALYPLDHVLGQVALCHSGEVPPTGFEPVPQA